jgi:hypothetical protein
VETTELIAGVSAQETANTDFEKMSDHRERMTVMLQTVLAPPSRENNRHLSICL